MKGAAWWLNGEARQALKQRGIKVRRWKGLIFKNETAFWLLSIAAGIGMNFLVSNLFDFQSVFFLLRWFIKIVIFFAGFSPASYFLEDGLRKELIHFSLELEPLRLYPSPLKFPTKKQFIAVWLVIVLFGWASWALPFFRIVPSNIKTIPQIVAYYTAQTKKQPAAVAVDIPSENGAAKIFEVRYGKNETVISIIRTTGSHKAVFIAKAGEANSFYVKDESGKIWPLKEARLKDYKAAAGVELVFAPFNARAFALIEGKDTTATAWHFSNIRIKD
jgi:hypothetical protein